MPRLFELFRKLADTPCIVPQLHSQQPPCRSSIIGVYDAFRPHWCDESKAAARENCILGVCVAKGMTMPGQLTDTEFAMCKKWSEPQVRAELLREKRDSGQPRIFGKRDFHRFNLHQHRETVKRNDLHNAVVLGARRIGLLSRLGLVSVKVIAVVVCSSTIIFSHWDDKYNEDELRLQQQLTMFLLSELFCFESVASSAD